VIITMTVPNLYGGDGKPFRFRMRVPDKLREHYGRREHKESFGYVDHNVAALKAEALTAKYKKQHRELQAAMKTGNAICTSKPKTDSTKPFDLSGVEHELHQLSEDLAGFETEQLNTLYYQVGNIRHSLKNVTQSDLSVESLGRTDLRPVLDQTLLELCQRLAGDEDLSDDILRRKTARLAIPSLQDMLTEMERKIPPLIGKFVGAATEPKLIDGRWKDASSPVDKEKKSRASKNEPSLSIALEGCLSEKKRGVTTVEDLRSSVALLSEWFKGDKPISFYTRERMKSFVDDCLLHLPPNRKKLKKWRDMELKDIVQKTKPEDLIAPDTMHNILSDLTTVFSYAVDEHHLFISRHPTTKLSAKLPEKIDDVDRSFTNDELKKILNNLVYDAENPSRYWVVMLGLFSGARLNELCQLHLNDLQRIGGTDCICISIDDADKTFKRLKNKPSRRTVPIHPELLEAGFMRYVKQRRKDTKGKNAQLFPELVYKEKSGYGRQVGDWFGRYKKKIKVIDPVKRGFHGFRHTFIMWSQNMAEMSDREILELTGHETKAISKDHKRYAHALTVKRLNAQLVKLDYGLSIPANPFME